MSCFSSFPSLFCFVNLEKYVRVILECQRPPCLAPRGLISHRVTSYCVLLVLVLVLMLVLSIHSYPSVVADCCCCGCRCRRCARSPCGLRTSVAGPSSPLLSFFHQRSGSSSRSEGLRSPGTLAWYSLSAFCVASRCASCSSRYSSLLSLSPSPNSLIWIKKSRRCSLN